MSYTPKHRSPRTPPQDGTGLPLEAPAHGLRALRGDQRGPNGTRTRNLLPAREVLYQLSYEPFAILDRHVGMEGFEPPVSCSQSKRADLAALHPERRVLAPNPATYTGPASAPAKTGGPGLSHMLSTVKFSITQCPRRTESFTQGRQDSNLRHLVLETSALTD